MQKCLTIAIFFLITALVTGCGGAGSTAKQLSAITTVPFAATDVSGKTVYSTSINGYVAYQFNSDNTAQWNSVPVAAGSPTLDVSGTWQIVDGVLFLSVSSVEAVRFTAIQKEGAGTSGEYLLAYNGSYSISRLYSDLTAAQDYLASVRVQLGGAVQTAPLSSALGTVTTIAGGAGIAAFTNSSSGTAARFNHPVGITTDGKNNFFIADYYNNAIRRIDENGNVTTFAGSSVGTAGRLDGTGTEARFNLPGGITTDGKHLYVADTGNNAIRKIDLSSGAVTLMAGSSNGVAGSIDSGTGTDARFNQPTGITTDGTNLYVADSLSNTIRKIVIATGAVSTLAGKAETSGSADGTGRDARFFYPARIATDGSNLYVTDFHNRTVRKIVIATGQVTTIAGKVGVSGSADGVGIIATFNQPNGITTDGTNLYVTDSYTNSIRKIEISSGTVSTLIGGTAEAPGHLDSVDGPPSFDTPVGITTDGTALYVTDSNNNTIRRIY